MLRSPFVATLLAVAAAMPGCARQGEACVVATVIDGDTFHCRNGAKVRLIGIDAPERTQGEAYGASREALRRIAGVGSTVHLERDVTPRDRYGRELAWVWHDTVLVSEAMVAQGYAVLFTVPPNVKYVDRIAAAQRRARDAGAGLWATGGFTCPPSDRRRRRC